MLKLPQVNKTTGVSADYWNEYASKITAIWYEGEKRFQEEMRKSPIKQYEERFDKYDIDFSNPRIDLLNQIARDVNEMFKRGLLSAKLFQNISGPVDKIIQNSDISFT